MVWPSTAPPWLASWTVWLLRGKRTKRPVQAPATIPWIGWQFEQFTLWRLRGGRPADRPHDLAPVIPSWAWGVVRRVLLLLHWPFPILFVGDPGEAAGVATRAAESGFASIALQLATFTAADVQAVNGAGLEAIGWGIAQDTDGARLALLDASAYVPQIEGPGQRDDAFVAFAAGTWKERPRGIVTNFSGLDDPSQARRLDAYVSATLVECYGPENPVAFDLDRMIWQAWRFSLPSPFPIVGLYRDVGTEGYPQLASYVPNFGVWRGLQMPERSWAQVRELVIG